MDAKVLCVYNLARGVFLSSKVTVADGANQPLTILKVLIGGLAMDAESGLWLSPVYGLPAVPRLFPFDLIYLDKDLRVLDLAEFLPGLEFPPYHQEVASALVLPSHILHSSQTERGDQLAIGLQEEVETQIGVFNPRRSADVTTIPSRGDHPGQAAQGRLEAAPRGAPGSLSATAASARTARAVAEKVLAAEPTPVAAVPVLGPSIKNASVVSIAKDQADATKVAPSTAERLAPAVEQSAESKIIERKTELIAAAPANATTEMPSAKVEDSQAPKTPLISITEVILERPRIAEPQVIVGHHGGIEDLFSNWVDSPSLASTWKARTAEPVRDQVKPGAAPPVVDAPVTESLATAAKRQTANGSASSMGPAPQTASEQVKEEPGLKPSAIASSVNQLKTRRQPSPPADSGAAAKAEKPKDVPLSKPKSVPSKAESPTVAPSQIPSPIRVALPQPSQATSSTVAQYGLWRVSMPTAVTPVATVKEPVEQRPKATAARASMEVAEKATDATKVSKATGINSPAAERPTSVSPTPTPQVPVKSLAEAISHFGPEVQPASREPAVEVAKQSAGKAVETTPRKPMVADYLQSDPAEERRKPVSKFAIPPAQDKSAATEAGQPSHERLQDAPAESTMHVLATDGLDTVQQKLGIGQAKVPEAATTTVTVGKAKEAPVEQTNKLPATESVARKEAAAHGETSLPLPAIGNAVQIVKPKTPIRRVEANGKAPAAALTLAERFKRWLSPAAPVNSDRRRAHRRYVPGMVAHYYTGGAPRPHDVADISMTGFYLLTEDRWMPDTMIQMTLQKPCAKGERKQSITVLSKIVRRGSDGVAAQFVMPESLDPHSHDVKPSQTTDRFALARFI